MIDFFYQSCVALHGLSVILVVKVVKLVCCFVIFLCVCGSWIQCSTTEHIVPWLYKYTESCLCDHVVCVVPSAPLNFENVSRTATSLSFSWISPTEVNGILQDYKVTFFTVQHITWEHGIFCSLPVCPYVSLPVCLLHWLIMSKWLNLSSDFFYVIISWKFTVFVHYLSRLFKVILGKKKNV